MTSSFKRFIDIPELLNLVKLYLVKADTAKFVRTNKKLNALCTPWLYRLIVVQDNRPLPLKMFCSAPALGALARNVHHVRLLSLGEDELVFYYHCVLAFEELNSRTLKAPLSRPTWMPPPDPHTVQAVAVPPMTHLSHLCLRQGLPMTRPYTMPRCVDHRRKLDQHCWLISLNPGLIQLNLRDLPMPDFGSVRLLASVLGQLPMLEGLIIGMYCARGNWLKILSYLFFSCQTSIRQLSIYFHDCTNMKDMRLVVAGGEEGKAKRSRNEDEVMALGVVRRQEPLMRLEELRIHMMHDFRWTSVTDICSMFSHCPNLKKLNISCMIGQQVVHTVGRFIGQECPRIHSLSCGSRHIKEHDHLPFRIMESLPAQQVTHLEYRGLLSDIYIAQVTSALQRHSTSLRSVCIHKSGGMDKTSIFPILRECGNLQELAIECSYGIAGHYITLYEALEAPWICTKLTCLALNISGCDLPVEPGVEPYYLRPTPITLTEVETQCFARLEDLYRRIGLLTELQHLDLRMVSLDTEGRVNMTMLCELRSFPAMMNLQVPGTGRPGFLHLFSGLKKLETLQGSVSADTDETRQTMGWPEVNWVDEHWPLLRVATFFRHPEDVTEPFDWLGLKRKDKMKVVFGYPHELRLADRIVQRDRVVISLK